ncbi:MAG: DUF2092 domain-containing protein [Amaricoccus sp.]
MTSRVATRTLAALLAAACCAPVAMAADKPAAAAPAAAAETATRGVSAQADRLLHEMGAYLAAAPEFTFSADVTFDHLLPTGQKLQFGATETVGVRRPDRVYVDWQSDLGERRFWYDGKTLTITDPATPFYAEETAPKTIDETLALVETKLGFAPPLGDFLQSDPYKALRTDVRYGIYLGTSEVAGRECHSLAFVNKQIDWQIWIDTGPQPTPCKLVITYLTRPGQPQFSAVFSDWNFAPRIAPESFTADLAPGSTKVPFKLQTAEGKK